MMPKISCIIPIYNREQFLSKCINSILSQTFCDFELILVDDGSTDGSLQICQEYANKDSRIKVIHKKNGGVSSARNAGIEIAQGEYITFVDSDDWIDSNMYEEMLKTTEKVQCDLIMCGMKKSNKNGEYEILQFNKSSQNKFYTSKKEVIELFCDLRQDETFAVELHAPVNKFFKSKLLNGEKEKTLRFDENMIASEDGLFCTQYFDKAMSACVVNKSFYNYIYNENSICNISRDLQKQNIINNNIRTLRLQTYSFYKKNNINANMQKKMFTFPRICSELFSDFPRDELRIFIESLVTPKFLIQNFFHHKKDTIKLIFYKMKLLQLFRKLKNVKH